MNKSPKSKVGALRASPKSELKIFNFSLLTFNSPLSGAGFTLVELLVVIAVIALIMAVLFPNFMGARERARDAQRKSDLRQIQSALELYKSDQTPPSYPTTGAFPASMCSTCWSQQESCSGNMYMRKFPCDPLTRLPYVYERNTPDPLKYSLSACLENIADPDKDEVLNPSCVTIGISYTIYEP